MESHITYPAKTHVKVSDTLGEIEIHMNEIIKCLSTLCIKSGITY